jgi:hypothetical protein
MTETGAADWVAKSFLDLLEGIGAGSGLGFNTAISLLTIGVSNTMTAGAAVAVLGPIVLNTAHVAGQDPIIAGFVTAISSAFGYLTPAGPARLHHHLCLRLPQGPRLLHHRLAHDGRLGHHPPGAREPLLAVHRAIE